MYKEVRTNKNTRNTLFLISLSLLTINPSDESASRNRFLSIVTIMILIDLLQFDLKGLLHVLVHFFSA